MDLFPLQEQVQCPGTCIPSLLTPVYKANLIQTHKVSLYVLSFLNYELIKEE